MTTSHSADDAVPENASRNSGLGPSSHPAGGIPAPPNPFHKARPRRDSAFQGSFEEVVPETSEGEQDNGEKDNQEEETEQRIWNVRSCLSIRPKEWEGRNLNFKYLPSREECETLRNGTATTMAQSWHPLDMNLSSIHSTKYMHVLEPLQRPADYMFPEGFGTTFPVGPRDEEFQELALAREKAALNIRGASFLQTMTRMRISKKRVLGTLETGSKSTPSRNMTSTKATSPKESPRTRAHRLGDTEIRD